MPTGSTRPGDGAWLCGTGPALRARAVAAEGGHRIAHNVHHRDATAETGLQTDRAVPGGAGLIGVQISAPRMGADPPAPGRGVKKLVVLLRGGPADLSTRTLFAARSRAQSPSLDAVQRSRRRRAGHSARRTCRARSPPARRQDACVDPAGAAAASATLVGVARWATKASQHASSIAENRRAQGLTPGPFTLLYENEIRPGGARSKRREVLSEPNPTHAASGSWRERDLLRRSRFRLRLKFSERRR
jgi:hypothetical protein